VGLVQSTTLLINIHGTLEHIPSISSKGLKAHVCSINSKLSAYKGLNMLEQAIWKLKIAEQTDRVTYLFDANMKMSCSLTLYQWLILSFLLFFPSSMALAIKIYWYLRALHIPDLHTVPFQVQ
jgi:hypothetical protein